jgi:short subunit dehydrogenase-like uncharacterized protein
MVPLWATIVLPMSLVYQVGKALVKTVLPKGEGGEEEPMSTLDSGYQVSDADIIPRPQRKYDVVILGATGFTGKLAARHLAKTYGVNNKDGVVKWAIAGRSQSKLDQIKQELADELGLDDDILLQLDTIIVDTSIASTMPKLVRDTRAVITTAGPFCQYGNSVVEFCAKFGTHYADITGESDWVRTMMLKWQDTARNSGAKIISLCGNDCVPWDLTVYQMARKLEEQDAKEDLVQVTCIDEFVSTVSGGTVLSMGLVMDGKGAPKSSSDPFRNTAAGSVHTEAMSDKLPMGIFGLIAPWNGEKVYGSPFIMSLVNKQAVGWTQALRGGKALEYVEFKVSPDFKTAFVDYFQITVFLTAMMNPLTRYLLQRYGLPKPGEGPSMKDMEENHFVAVNAQGVGSKGTKAEAVMYFPKCPGYLETARMVTECGLCLALQEDQLPSQGGGFFSPAFALGDVLLKRLTDTGTYFNMKLTPESKK